MPPLGQIGVIFELSRAKTSPGEAVRVVGDRQELGRWKASDNSESDALMMRTSALMYPRCCMASPVWLQPDEFSDMPELVVSYKYVIEGKHHSESRSQLFWEQRDLNRTVTLPCRPGMIYVVTDDEFGDSSMPAQLSCASFAEVVRLHESIDPDWKWQNLCRAPTATATVSRRSSTGSQPMWKAQEMVQELEARSRRTSLAQDVRSCVGSRRHSCGGATPVSCEMDFAEMKRQLSGEGPADTTDPIELLLASLREEKLKVSIERLGGLAAKWQERAGQAEAAASQAEAAAAQDSGRGGDSAAAAAEEQASLSRRVSPGESLPGSPESSVCEDSSLPALAPHELLEECEDAPRPPGSSYWDWPLDRPQCKTRLQMIERRMKQMAHEEAIAEMQCRHEVAIQELQAERDGLAVLLRKATGPPPAVSTRRTARNGGG